MPPPSGRQIELVRGTQRAVIVEGGGGLREYVVDGRDVVDGYAVEDACDGARGQVLAPWPNRIDRGRYRFGGLDLQLPVTEPGRGNAIHGLVSGARWEVAARAGDRVVMVHALEPGPGYPFTLRLEITYALTGDGLTVTACARNAGHAPLPFGLGFHPYLTVGTAHIDDASLHIPAASFLDLDARGIPTADPVRDVTGTAMDFRRARPIGGQRLDDCFTGFSGSRVRVTMGDARLGREVGLWMDPPFGHVMVFTGDTLAAARRRRGLAVEPMTCPPDAFNSGIGLIVLGPGDGHSFRWGIEARQVRG